QRLTKHFCLSLFAIYLAVFGQARHDAQRLEPTQILERELAGGETHTYQITLQAGQFLRVMVEQQGVDVALALVTPDGKQITEVNFTGSSEQESLSHEAAAGGEYRMLISVPAATAPRGAYRVRLEVKGAATAEDKERIGAGLLLGEAFQLSRQGAGGAQQIVEKAPQVAQQWRELGDRYWEAYSLNLTGD